VIAPATAHVLRRWRTGWRMISDNDAAGDDGAGGCCACNEREYVDHAATQANVKLLRERGWCCRSGQRVSGVRDDRVG